MKKQVVSASVTPLLENGELDRLGLKNLIGRNIRHGLDGIFILGSMGEWESFSSAFKREYVEECVRAADGRIRLLVGINATSLNLSLEHIEEYRNLDFDSYVFMLPRNSSLLDPVRAVRRVLDAADRPVYYYHCPPNNGVELSLGQFAEIMEHPNLKGIKNSSSNMWLRRELLLLKQERDFKALLFEGQEWAVDEALMAGCDGMICGMGALVSKVMVRLAQAASEGDFRKAVGLQNLMIRIFHGIYGRDLENVWNGQKYALMKLGLIASPMTFAQDMDSLTEAAKRRIDDTLEAMKEELD